MVAHCLDLVRAEDYHIFVTVFLFILFATITVTSGVTVIFFADFLKVSSKINEGTKCICITVLLQSSLSIL